MFATSISPERLAQLVAANVPINSTAVEEKEYKVLEQAIEKDLDNIDDFDSAIQRLFELGDLRKGIRWKVIEGEDRSFSAKDDDHRPIVIRDARTVTADAKPSYEHFAVLGINHIRAARALFKTADPAINKEEYLQSLAKDFFARIKIAEYPEAELANFNNRLIAFVAEKFEIDQEEANHRLTVARDFANLEDETRHVVTINKPIKKDDKTVLSFTADIALCGDLTPAQQAEYKTCDEAEKTQQKEWYRELPAWNQQLVKNFRHFITGDNDTKPRVIPTQLRTCTVGVRNAYVTVAGRLDSSGAQDEKGVAALQATILDEQLHCGTLAHMSKAKTISATENARITALNREQLEQMTGAVGVHFIVLNSNRNKKKEDPIIVARTQQAMAESKQSTLSLAPVNAARYIATNDYSGIEQLIHAVDIFLTAKYGAHATSIVNYLRGILDVEQFDIDEGPQSGVAGTIAALNTLLPDSSHERRMIDAAIHCRYFITHSSAEDVTNVRLVSYAQILSSSARMMMPPQEDKLNLVVTNYLTSPTEENRDALFLAATDFYQNLLDNNVGKILGADDVNQELEKFIGNGKLPANAEKAILSLVETTNLMALNASSEVERIFAEQVKKLPNNHHAQQNSEEFIAAKVQQQKVAVLQYVATSLQHSFEHQKALQQVTPVLKKPVVVACQSGKDRTRVVALNTSAAVVSSELNGNLPARVANDIILQAAQSGHQQFMAGYQGATYGCVGIKSDTKWMLRGSRQGFYPADAVRSLCLPTGNFNKALKTRKETEYIDCDSIDVSEQIRHIIHVLEVQKFIIANHSTSWRHNTKLSQARIENIINPLLKILLAKDERKPANLDKLLELINTFAEHNARLTGEHSWPWDGGGTTQKLLDNIWENLDVVIRNEQRPQPAVAEEKQQHASPAAR